MTNDQLPITNYQQQTMIKLLGFIALGTLITFPALAEQPLNVVFPPNNHQTTSDRIFLLGTAPGEGNVLVNGKPIQRSSAGHFAPSFSLQMGDNIFTLQYQNQSRQITVTRLSNLPTPPTGLAFAKDSLTPGVDIARMPGELICFSAIAPPNANVSVKLNNINIPLIPQPQTIDLPPNSAALTGQYQIPPTPLDKGEAGEITQYQGCASANSPGNLGNPQYQLTLNGKNITQISQGKVQILSPTQLEIAEVIVDAGTARSGPSTDYSRLTPLPKGTQASIIGREGEWVKFDYGAWIKSQEIRILPGNVPPSSIIRSVNARQVSGATEIIFPLQVPVPVSVQEGDRTFTLTLYNTTAQTDIIRLDDDPVISRLDWQQVAPGKVQYIFNLKSAQQWGYQLRYEGRNLVLSLRHSPTTSLGRKSGVDKPLSGIKILLDPGHGGTEPGAAGPTGYLEKDVNLIISKMVRDRLVEKGATVYMTRDNDQTVSLNERVAIINKLQPAIAISIHHNSLPDNGDAENTKGFSAFWYNSQSHSLAMFIHNYVVQKLTHPSYGVFWNNLALTRPTTTPSILLELGFMSNPVEFESVINTQHQQKMAATIAEAITEWFRLY